MSNPDPDGPSPQDQWLQVIGVSRDLLARTAQVLPAGTSVLATAVPPAKSSVLISIAISVPAPLERDGQQQLTATGTFSVGRPRDLTSTVKWSSSDENVVKVAPGGLATVGSASGKVTIAATAAGGKVSGSIKVTIRAALKDIIIKPQDPLVESTKTQELTATAVYTDGDTEDITDKVVWKSSKPKVADFITSPGVCVANEAGTAPVTATHAASQKFGSTEITVHPAGKAPTLRKVTISPLNPDIKSMTPVPFQAMGTYSDGPPHEITGKVTWKSSDEKILVIDGKGVAKARLVSGNALISGIDPTTNLYQSTTCYVEMPGVKSFTVSPKNISLVSGDAMPVTATVALHGGGEATVIDLVKWTSSDSPVAEMFVQYGEVWGGNPGGATIEAFEPTSGLSEIIIVEVLPPVLRSIVVLTSPPGETFPIGQKLQFTAKGKLSDRSFRELKKVKWSALPAGVVDIDQKGGATAKKAGTVKITAEDADTPVPPGSVDLTIQ